jgi:CheY-specific phosphatase CheX
MNALEPLASSTEVDLIVAAVFQAMLGLEVEPAGEVQPSEPAEMNATVHLGGTWDGALMLETSRSQACRLAGRFLSIDPPPAVDDNVRDVMGELANMIGGNLKCALAPGATLSMPAVTDGSDYSLRIGNGVLVEKRAFSCAEGLFWVSRIEASWGPVDIS